MYTVTSTFVACYQRRHVIKRKSQLSFVLGCHELPMSRRDYDRLPTYVLPFRPFTRMKESYYALGRATTDTEAPIVLTASNTRATYSTQVTLSPFSNTPFLQ